MVATQFSTHIKILRYDNGIEYTSHDMTNYLISNSILHQTSCVKTPQQNRVAERKNCELLENTQAIMIQMNVSKNLIGPMEFSRLLILSIVYPVEYWISNVQLRYCREKNQIYLF